MPRSPAWRLSSSTRTYASRARYDGLVRVEEFFVDVGPELFEGEVGGVDDVAGEPLLADFGPGAVLGGVVEGGYAGGGA